MLTRLPFTLFVHRLLQTLDEDNEISGATTQVPFVHTPEEKLLVFRNGVLQEEGGTADYLASAAASTITFWIQTTS